MKLKKTARQIFRELWQPTIGYTVALLALFGILIHSVKDMLPGFSISEKATIAASRSGAVIMDNPLDAPHKILQYVMSKLAHNGFTAMRGVSIIFGMLLVVLFFYTVKRWFSFRVAVITTILFATCSWFLHITRLATTDIMMLSSIAAIAYGAWLPTTKKYKLAAFIGFSLAIWLMYIPGMIWFIVLGVIWQKRTISSVVKQEKSTFLVLIISFLALLAPLVYALARDPHLLLTYAGLSQDPLAQLINIPKNLILIPIHLVIRTTFDPVYGVGRMPLLDIFAVAMAVLGIYNYFVTDKLLDRTKVLFGGIVVSCILISLGGAVGIQILLPFIYLLVAGGIAYMLQQWFKVFPTNPFAKSLATLLIAAAVLAVTYYHGTSYFVTWPNVPATRAVFDQQP